MLCLVLCGFSAGCYDSHFGTPPDIPSPPPTLTIADLHARFVGFSTVVKDDLVVRGIVTSSDKERNFYRTLVIEQEGFALEIMAGTDHLHNDYPLGSTVSLRLRDLAVGRQRGILQAGAPPVAGSGRPIEYLPSQAVLQQHLVRGSEPLRQPDLLTCSIRDLIPSWCGRTVCIGNLSPVSDKEDTLPTVWAGTHRFTDGEGHEIETYVRKYARFADDPIPAECTITGILQFDGRTYTLKPRSRDDLRP